MDIVNNLFKDLNIPDKLTLSNFLLDKDINKIKVHKIEHDVILVISEKELLCLTPIEGDTSKQVSIIIYALATKLEYTDLEKVVIPDHLAPLLTKVLALQYNTYFEVEKSSHVLTARKEFDLHEGHYELPKHYSVSRQHGYKHRRIGVYKGCEEKAFVRMNETISNEATYLDKVDWLNNCCLTNPSTACVIQNINFDTKATLQFLVGKIIDEYKTFENCPSIYLYVETTPKNDTAVAVTTEAGFKLASTHTHYICK